MPVSAFASNRPATVSPIIGEQDVVAVEQAAAVKVSTVAGDDVAVAVEGVETAQVSDVQGVAPIAAVDSVQTAKVAAIRNDPAMAAVGMLSQTMVAAAQAIEVSLIRQELTVVTPSIAAGGVHDFVLDAGGIFKLTSFTASTPAWVRVYDSASARSADGRVQPGGNVPAAGSGFYAELATVSSPQSIRLSPVPTVQVNDGLAYVRVVNRDSVSRAITLTFVVYLLER